MKLLRILTLLLCLCLCAPAMAEPNGLTLLYTYPEGMQVDLLPEADRLTVGSWGKKALAALDGTLLTGEEYSSFSCRHGWLEVTSATETAVIPDQDQALPLKGVLSPDGQPVVPVAYNYVSIENEHWALGYHLEKTDDSDHDMSVFVFGGNDFNANVTSLDVYDLDSAALVAALSRDRYRYIEFNGTYANVLTSDGKVTGYNAAFDPVAEGLNNVYDFSYAGITAEAEDDGQSVPQEFRDEETGLYGIRDAADSTVLPAEYSYVYISDFRNGVADFYVEKDYDNAYGLIGSDGRILLEPVYKEIYLDNCKSGYTRVTIDLDGVEKQGVAASDGTFVLPVEYDSVTIEEEHLIGYAEKDGAYTLFASAGALYLDGLSPDTCSIDMNGQSLTVDRSDADLSDLIVNMDGTVYAYEGYTYCYDVGHTDGRYYNVQDADDVYSVIDSYGNVVLAGFYAEAANAAGTLMLVRDAEGVYSLYRIN